MSIKPHSNTIRRAVLAAAVVLSLALLAGCSDETAAGPNTANSTGAASETHAAAEQREAVFSVPGMECPMCPITVKRAFSGVDGVIEADADLKTRQARALFDPSRTDTDTLIAAIENSGFSAQLKENDHE